MSESPSVAATPETVRWGAFDAAFPPVARVASGGRVTLECVSGGPETMPSPESGLRPHPALAAIHAGVPRLGPHILTGPVEVEGAEPGDALRVEIEAVEPGADWGFCGHRPLAGALPSDFDRSMLTHIPVDRAARTARLPYGRGYTLPLSPFFGVMGVAPPPAWGRISSKEPRAHGGNLDNKELVAGTTLFLPVHVAGALFSAGDGHGMQGDGEVCVNALETCLTGTFRLTVERGGGAADPLLRAPRAETPTHLISMGLDEDLDRALRLAIREMIALLVERAGLSRGEAYQLCSLAADFRVTQAVNGEKGVHGMLSKALLL